MTRKAMGSATPVGIHSVVVDDRYPDGPSVVRRAVTVDEEPLPSTAANRALLALIKAASAIARDSRAVGGGESGSLRKRLMANRSLGRFQTAVDDVLEIGLRVLKVPTVDDETRLMAALAMEGCTYREIASSFRIRGTGSTHAEFVARV